MSDEPITIDERTQRVVPKAADKQAIGRDYRAGVLSNREVGNLHGVSEGYVRKLAKKEGWERDLNQQVQARADALVRTEEVRTQYEASVLISEKQTVEASALALANVKLGNKRIINRLGVLAESLMSELEVQTSNPELLEQFTDMMRRPNEHGADRLNDLMQKVISLPGRVDTTKKLAETLRMYVSMMREAWGMDLKGAEEPGAVNTLQALLSGMKRSALPVVHQVERDDGI